MDFVHRCAEEGFTRTLSTELPGRLLGDKAYDSDALDGRLEEAWGIEMIAPNRKTQAKTQDGRPLRGPPPLERRAAVCLAAKLSSYCFTI